MSSLNTFARLVARAIVTSTEPPSIRGTTTLETPLVLREELTNKMSTSTPARRQPMLRLGAVAAVIAALSFSLAAVGSSAASGSTLTLTRITANTPGFGPVRQDTGNDAMVNSLLFSNLVKIAPNEKTILPDLSTRWTVSKDARVYTFFLRKGVKWSDGKPFTAKDVVFTITQAAQFGTTPYIGYQPVKWREVQGATAIQGTTKPLVGAKAVGDYEVRLTLAQPDALFVRALTDAVYAILPAHLLASATAKNISTVPFTTTNPVGTGPYTLAKDVPNQYLEFAANPSYFGGKPKIQTIFFKLNVSASSAVAQLESGELDLALDLNPADAPQLAKAHGLTSAFVTSPAAEFIEFRVDYPQVSDARVRQAIYYAVDRRAMLKDLFKGHGKVLWTLPGFNQSDPALNRYPYDPAKAKQLLKAAKFDFSKPLNIVYVSGDAEDPVWDQMVPVIQKDLKNIGVHAVLDPLANTAWVNDLSATKAPFGVTLNSGGAMGLGPDRSSIYFNCKAPLSTFYANCKLDALYAKALTQTNAKARAATYAEAALILNRQLPELALWETDNLDAWTTKLGGSFKVFSNDRDSLFNIKGWTLSG